MLTLKQEKFVQGLLNGLSQRESYKQAYECKNMSDKSIDELSNLYQQKKLKTNKILEIPNDNQEVTFRTQKSTYNRDNNLQEPNSFPEMKFVSLKKEGCKYILDRRYSGSSLSNFKVELVKNGERIL